MKAHWPAFMLCVASALCAAPGVHAQTGADFYRGKTIRLSVGTSPGGINDISARLMARHMGKFIPGAPSFNVQNMPGAGGIIGANRLAHSVDKDGTEIAILERAVAQFAIAGDKNAKFDPLTLTWLGSLSSYGDDAYMMLVMAKHPAITAEDLRKPGMKVVMGSNRAGSTNVIFALLAKQVLGMNVDVITGYGGAAKIALAMQSGEVDGQVIGLSAFQAGQKNMWDDKLVRPLVVFGRTTRHPEMPDIPTGRELALSEDGRKLLEFSELPFFMALPFVGPPNMDAGRTNILRKAFMDVAKDKALLEEANRLALDISPIDHIAIDKLLREAKQTPEKVMGEFRTLMGGAF
jgi:tripartite-type tricarboxylate transporter receptor subunit TctC